MFTNKLSLENQPLARGSMVQVQLSWVITIESEQLYWALLSKKQEATPIPLLHVAVQSQQTLY